METIAGWKNRFAPASPVHKRPGRKFLLQLPLFFFLLLLCATSQGAGAPKGDPEAGRAIYQKYCRYCHGRTGRGDGAIGIAVSPHPADFVGDRKRMSKSDEELFKSISEGVKKEIGGDEMSMPSWKGILTEKERWDVLRYIRLLEKKGLEEEQMSEGEEK